MATYARKLETEHIPAQATPVAGTPLSIVPEERMRKWLLFEWNSSAPLIFSESVMLQSQDIDGVAMGDMLNTATKNWKGANLYCPQESYDGVVYGTVLGNFDPHEIGCAENVRFCIDCRGSEMNVYIGGVETVSEAASLTRLTVTSEGDLITSNAVFNLRRPSETISAADIFEKKMCDFCFARGLQICECPPSFKSRLSLDIAEEFAKVKIQSIESGDNPYDLTFWTEELAAFSSHVFSGRFSISRVIKSGMASGRRTSMSQFGKDYSFVVEGESLERAREALAFEYYSKTNYRQLALPDYEIGLNEDQLFFLNDDSGKDFFIEQISDNDESKTEPNLLNTEEVSSDFRGSSSDQCPICGAAFRRKYEMQRHYRTVHLGERKFACEYCGNKFIHKSHLRVHISSVHEGIAEEKCQQCGKGFATKAKLNRHVLAVHEKQRIHGCEECGKKFFQRSDLKKHRTIHSTA
ncbi:hypothetical protein NDN08_008257 [Rhodosorus marinus]|uniref:C2H2-type domain-containing protein n=1 Tax=Rhodosorus marinus TaxID=101924 RepID=A0AAV8UZU6_9RHOD|nr:hypothetical protein NDN08_008257 [Rhodosorus marinus]